METPDLRYDIAVESLRHIVLFSGGGNVVNVGVTVKIRSPQLLVHLIGGIEGRGSFGRCSSRVVDMSVFKGVFLWSGLHRVVCLRLLTPSTNNVWPASALSGTCKVRSS